VSPFAVPREALARDCKCPKKRKPAKKRAARVVCKAGGYQQTAKGIIYRPNREVPCT